MQRAGDRLLNNHQRGTVGRIPCPVPPFPSLSNERFQTMAHTMRVRTVDVHYEGPSIDRERLDQPEIAGEFLTSWVANMSHRDGIDSDAERFGFLALDGRHRLLGVKVLSIGTSTQCPVDGRKLFKAALYLDAFGIILFHNHPSDDLEPSRDDMDLTRRLVMGGQFLGVSVHDHFIIAGGRWVSLRSTHADLFAG